MMSKPDLEPTEQGADAQQPRTKRVDAQRNLRSLLQAALDVFAESGVDAPVRAIAERAGVGVGTVYRHFPQRADLIVAVMKSQIDDCADAAATIAAEHEPGEALAHWMQRYVDFILTKRGLSGALQSDSAAYAALPEYFYGRLRPALTSLLNKAVEQNVIRPGYEADELLRAVATLCKSNPDEDTAATRKMVGLIVDGLRCRP
jgi:AcrR family transcriptional regulator